VALGVGMRALQVNLALQAWMLSQCILPSHLAEAAPPDLKVQVCSDIQA
jgi:hypothetical protein